MISGTITLTPKSGLPYDKISTGLQLGLMQAGTMIQNTAKEKSPYDTGTLRRSISMDTSKITTGEVSVGTEVEYGKIREYINKKNPSRKFYMKKTVAQRKGEILALFDNIIQGALQQ